MESIIGCFPIDYINSRCKKITTNVDFGSSAHRLRIGLMFDILNLQDKFSYLIVLNRDITNNMFLIFINIDLFLIVLTIYFLN